MHKDHRTSGHYHDHELLAYEELLALKLEKIKQALKRIEAGEYFYCSECGEEIPAARLELLPFTTHCVRCAEKLEDLQDCPMRNEKHDLIHELPQHRDTIHQLKTSNPYFARLFDEYHEVDHEVHRIETGIENTSDEYLEQRKKIRLSLKDELFDMIKQAE